jgi:hypothetical protein
MKEEYAYSYNKFRRFMDSDRAKIELGHVQEHIWDSYIQSSFLPKEHQVMRYARNAVRAFDSCTSCQAENKNISLKAPGGIKPHHNIHRSEVEKVNKAEHRYQVNAYVSGRAIVVTQLWSKLTTAQSLTRIAEGLCRAQVTSKNDYFVKMMSQLLFLVVTKKVELNPNAIPGGWPQIVRLRVVQFEVDGSVCCSCEFFEMVGIVCRNILAIAHLLDESMADVRWRGTLGFYFGKAMYARVTSVIMQALESSLKKVKAPIQPQAVWYPFSEGAKECHISPFIKKGVERIFLTKTKYLLHQLRVTEYDGQCIEALPLYGEDDDSNDEEITSNKFVGDTYLGASEFHSRLLSDTTTRRKLKAREAFTVPFYFLCDCADQSEEHMSFIAAKLEILKR